MKGGKLRSELTKSALSAEGTDARTAVLDPVGAELESGPTGYFNLINTLTRSLLGCLQG